jgi:hypothetical protein
MSAYIAAWLAVALAGSTPGIAIAAVVIVRELRHQEVE